MPTTIGAFINAVGILLGSIFGMARQAPLSLRAQLLLRNAIGMANFLCGARLMYVSIGGTALACLKQIFIAVLAVILGFWVGKLFRFQRMSNYLGHLAGNAIVAAQKNPGQNPGDGLNACAILFCAAPLGLIGAVTDGLSGNFYLLAVKAVMDAMAMTGFVRLFRWQSSLSAIPVFVFFSAISMAVQFYIAPHLQAPELNSVNATAGLLACIVTIVVFEIRKVPLANYLPALVIAPLLTKLFH